MSRDIHSPAGFDPQKYTYVGAFYQGSMEEAQEFNDEFDWSLLDNSTYHGNWHRLRSCDHCGARFAWGAAYRHENGDVIAVGKYCAANAFGSETKREADLKRLARAIALSREKTKLGKLIREFLEENPGLEEALSVKHHIITDMNSQLIRYGKLSEKQVAFAIKLADDVTKRAESAVPIVPGKRTIVGVVLGAKQKVDDFDGSITYKMLVQCESGEIMWGSIPIDIVRELDRREYMWWTALKKCKVQFNANVEVARNDPNFGIFKRPTKARILERPHQG